MNREDEINIIMDKYEKGKELVEKRREQWQMVVKETMMPTLKDICAIINSDKTMKVYCKYFDAKSKVRGIGRNFETVQFWIGKEPTGVHFNQGNNSESDYDQGAHLVFSQEVSGRVVIIHYPHNSTLIVPKDKYKVAEVIDMPEDITSDKVIDIVINFMNFSFSTSYKSTGIDGGQKPPIGFARTQDQD